MLGFRIKCMNTMFKEYEVKRKLQEQGGSYFVFLPKLWVDSLDLKQGDQMKILFNGIVKILPPNYLEGGEKDK